MALRLQPSNSLVAATVSLALFGCGLGLSPRAEVVEQASSSAKPAKDDIPSAGPPRALPGIDQEKLDESERQAVWDIAQQSYAPCTNEAVSLVQCIEEQRSCATCKPALEFLVEKVDSGSARANARAALKQRFDPSSVVEVPAGTSPALGPQTAPITIVVFSDFECPACKAVTPLLEELQHKFPQDVRLVHKYFPLSKHLRARYAARAAFAAHKQGRYWEMEKLIFENQGALSDQDLERYAAQAGLDLARYRTDKDSPEAEQAIEDDLALGDAAGLTHTPFVLINGREFDPAYFRYDDDLTPWIELEKKLVAAKK
jgi:protein-disulfide isomerase